MVDSVEVWVRGLIGRGVCVGWFLSNQAPPTKPDPTTHHILFRLRLVHTAGAKGALVVGGAPGAVRVGGAVGADGAVANLEARRAVGPPAGGRHRTAGPVVDVCRCLQWRKKGGGFAVTSEIKSGRETIKTKTIKYNYARSLLWQPSQHNRAGRTGGGEGETLARGGAPSTGSVGRAL